MSSLRPCLRCDLSPTTSGPIAAGLACCVAALMAIGCQSETSTPVPTTAGPATAPATPATEDLASESETVETNVDDSASENADKVLRHAVFFSFKESSSAEDVQGVADAFAALPSKVDSIIDFQWGTNNSPEKLDDGFTHCFLLTFKDTAGRETYLPHPAHKGEFADALRPHMKDVFVIDYWGTPPEQEIEKELKHAVFFKFKDDAAAEDTKKVEDEFAALPSKIDSIKAFEWGKNNSPEKHDDGFTHCFMVTFDSEEGRKEYLPHTAHKAFVETLTPVLDKVRVLDFWEQ